jgi:probable DNA repair protein
MDALEALLQDTVLITATDRLARDLHIRAGILRRDAGLSVWERPAIHSLRDWAARTWEACWPETQLLHPIQEIVLYKQIIDASPTGRQLLNTSSTARMVRRAGGLMTTYRIDRAHSSFRGSAEAVTFLEWLDTLEKRLARHGWTTPERMVDELISFIGDGRAAVPTKAAFVGFTEMTPQDRELHTVLASRGCELVFLDRIGEDLVATRCARPVTPTSELRAAAGWVRDLLMPHAGDPSKAPRIAILVPKLSDYRAHFDTLLTEVVAPQHLVPSETEHAVPWRFSQGVMLSDDDVVAAALTALEIRRYGNDCHLVSRFLLSRRFGNGPEYYARAAIDYALREKAGRFVSLSEILYQARRDGMTNCPQFAGRLECLDGVLKQENGAVLPSEWVNRFQERLRCVGWPGGALSSAGFQAVRAWEECLSLFASMDSQIGKIRARAALGYLGEIVSSREHQPRVPYAQPVQILEYEEAVGMRFDTALVVGMDASRLPPPVDPYPFVPIDVQRQYRVPESVHETSYSHGEHLLKQLSHVAKEVIFSCPATTDEGIDLYPCPLVDGWHEAAEFVPIEASHREQILAGGLMAAFPDSDPVPRVRDPEAEAVRGGSRILESFADQPFIAFARHRLNLKPFPQHEAGITSLIQGLMVHDVLRRVWDSLKTSDALRALANEAQTALVKECVELSVKEGGHLVPWRHGKRLAELEIARVVALVDKWLHYERKRPERFEVIHREAPVSGTISGLTMPFRIDRIDRVLAVAGSERYLVLDYKSGAEVSASSWKNGRLDSPQLPLYATVAELKTIGVPRVDGIAFAHVAEDGIRFVGITNWTAALVPDSKGVAQADNWSAQLHDWYTTLAEQAKLFMLGEARVDVARLQGHFTDGDLAVLARYGTVR